MERESEVIVGLKDKSSVKKVQEKHGLKEENLIRQELKTEKCFRVRVQLFSLCQKNYILDTDFLKRSLEIDIRKKHC